MQTPAECGVCVGAERRLVACPWCDFAACGKCLRRALEESINPAACCGCRKAWTDDFLAEQLGNAWFCGKYRTSRAVVMLDRQRAMFAATMPDVEVEKRTRTHAETVKRLKAERRALTRRMREIRTEIVMADQRQAVPPRAARESAVDSARCATPDCRGFVTRADPVCVVCANTTCWSCLAAVPAETPHECDPEAVATAREVRKSTVACPGCRTRIQRSHGCDQMFCVVCHVAFSYRTGERDHGPVHNPHYFALINELGQRPPPRPDGECRDGAFPSTARWNTKISATMRKRVTEHVRIALHIEAVEIPRLAIPEDPMREHRVRYILGEISDAKFAARIKRTDFDVKVKEHYAAILRAFVDASRGVVQRMDRAVREIAPSAVMVMHDSTIEPLERELGAIASLVNEAAKRVGETYKRRYFAIDTNEVKWVVGSAAK